MRHEGFLRAICEQPDDDAPRLIYADWLDDAGVPARAEFIRLQCQRAALDPDDPVQRSLFARESELLQQHSKEWLAELPKLSGVKWGGRPIFERGFLASAEFGSPTALRRHLATVQAATPLVRGTFPRFGPEQVSPLVSWEGLARLRALGFTSCTIASELILALANSPHPTRLVSLDLSLPWPADSGPLSPEAITTLAQSPVFAGLRHLGMRGLQWTEETLIAFAQHANFNGLERLGLSGMWGPILPHLADGPGFPGLRRLCLDVRTQDPDAHLGPILRAPWAAGLRRLALPEVHHVLSRGRLVRTLLGSPLLSGLRCLDLTKTQLYGTEEVARATNLTNLVFLRLGEGFISPAQLETLMNSTQFPELRELHLDWWTLEPDHIDVIAGRTGLPKLELLVPVHVRPATLRRYRERCSDLPIRIGSSVPSPYTWLTELTR